MTAPVFVVLHAPDRSSHRLRLHHVGSAWQSSYLFDQEGTWTLRTSVASARVQVRSRLVAPPSASTFSPLGVPGCNPPSPANAFTGEIRGSAGTGDLWALYFADLRSSEAVSYGVVGKGTKIVWKIQGTGEARFTATSPSGNVLQPSWVTSHGDSIWNRPGNEWGTGFVFTQPGCWQLQVERADNAGDVWLLVRS